MTNTMKALAERISWISESSTMKVAAEAGRLKREGIDVVDFSAGEPDFPTPVNIKNAAIDALNKNFTKYTPISGTPEGALGQPRGTAGQVPSIPYALVGVSVRSRRPSSTIALRYSSQSGCSPATDR